MASPRPLAGKRIVVTRARAQASSLVAALAELGAEVIELPTIETVPLESYEALEDALRNISRYQWLIVTSANTAKVLAERLVVLGLDGSVFAALGRVAIGSATARAMRERGIGVDLIPEEYVAESLVGAMEDSAQRRVETQVSNECHSDDPGEEEFQRTAKRHDPAKSLPESPAFQGSRILLARAAVARDVIPEELARRGTIVDVVDAYRTVIPDGAVDRVRKVFSAASRPPDAVTFTSSSTVKNFFTLWREAGFDGIPEGIAALSIGPITSETLREFGWEPAREAKQHDVEGLVEAVVGRFAERDFGT